MRHRRPHRIVILGQALAVLLIAARTAAQVPPEVSGLTWCAGAKDCLQWNAATGATSYKVHSGRLSTMRGLLNVTTDSCLATSAASTSTGPALSDTPTPCGLFWYLVDGVNASGEGTAGIATAGTRLLNSSGSCSACAGAGAACNDDDSCCSGRCFGGSCQDACCKAPGTTCTVGADCCSGLCNGGLCAATPQCPYGQAACNGVCSTPACASQGVCAGQTIPVFCKDQTTLSCNYSGVPNVELDANGSLVASEHLCDGRDGNCNGVVDLDGFPGLGQACGAGLGVCRTAGTVICTTSTSAGCNAVSNNAAAVNELCDGKDNDCDGLIDERSSGPGPFVGWVDPMVAVSAPGGGTVWVYQYEASRPDATSASAGSLPSRACSKVGVLPWAELTEPQAALACATVRDSFGASMRLCTAAEWQAACEGPTGAATQKWSESFNPTSYMVQVCNDANQAACHAVWPTGTNGPPPSNFCYTDWGAAGKIRDLSGNLAEWTSSTVTSNGTTYYKVRGGSFFAPSSGTTCELDGRYEQPSAARGDVGFRCCADHAP